MKTVMTRREALHRVGLLLGGAVAAPLAAGVLQGCRARNPGEAYALQALSPDQNELVVALTERIIPETDTPGARTARVHTFIDEMMARWYPAPDREHFLAGLDDVEEQAQAEYGRAFAACTLEEQDALVLRLDREAFPEAYGETRPETAQAPAQDERPPFFRLLKELTIVGYYTSEQGATEELRLNPMVPYQGDVPYEALGRAWA